MLVSTVVITLLPTPILAGSATAETEPNNEQSQAQLIQLGDTLRASLDDADRSDWYQFTFPANGKLKLTYYSEATLEISNPRVYIENGNSRFRSPEGSTGFVVEIPDLAKGVYWINFSRYSGAGNYRFILEYIALAVADDPEPNDTFHEAVELKDGTTITGTLGFERVEKDYYDWYFLQLNQEGGVELKFRSDDVLQINTVRLYNIDGDTIENRSSSDGWKYDFSLIETDMEAGKYYMRVPRYNYFGTYQISYRFLPADRPNDPEPNNTFHQAIELKNGDVVTGHLGFSYDTDVQDKADWYKIRVTENSICEFAFLTDSVLQINNPWLYEPVGDTLQNYDHSESWRYNFKFRSVDVTPGLYYLYVPRYNYHGTYTFSYSCTPQLIGFDVSRYNATVKLMNKSNGDEFEWNFGDGSSKSYVRFPEHTYTAPGDYVITQKVWFAGSSSPQTSQQVVSIKGIESFTPVKTGNGGDFTFTVYGGGLDAQTRIELKGTMMTLEPDTIIKQVNGRIEALFDLHFADAGMYDVVITVPGNSPVVFEDGLTIEGIDYPHVVSRISGYDVIRAGRSFTYHLVLTNTGNVSAKGVTAYLALADDLEFSSKLSTFSSTIDTTGSFSYYDEELSKTFTVDNKKVKAMMELLRTDYVAIDSLFGEPFKGRVYQLFVPVINAGATLKIPFKIKSVTNQASSESGMRSFVLPVNMFGSCASPQSTEAVNKSVDILLANLEKVPIVDKNPYLKTFVKVTNMGKTALRNASSYFGYLWGGMSEKEAWHEAYIADGQLEKANAEVISGLKDWATELGLEKLKSMTEAQLLQYKEDRALFTKMSLQAHKAGEKQAFSIWKGVAKDNHQRFVRLQTLQGMLDKTMNLSAMYNEVTNNGGDVKELLELVVKDCPELKKQLPVLMKYLNDNSGETNLFLKDMLAGTSEDPNEIEGPRGYTLNRYIAEDEKMDYLIRFENKAEAPMAAQLVNVYDTLDVNTFDLSTFELGDVSVGDTTLAVPTGRKEYFMVYNMQPRLPLEVGISARLNDSTGIVHWQFVAMDPGTNELTNDPILGFLPPNKLAPMGEGSVSYSVRLKNNLPDTTRISNRASIVFDYNLPIRTNTWINTLDKSAPTAVVEAIEQQNDSVFTVRWTGTDAGSSVRFYELYCSVDDQEFVNLGSFQTTSVTLKGILQSSYSFCVIPVDSVGNRQQKEMNAEKKITLKPAAIDETVLHTLKLYPNPARSEVTIEMGRSSGPVNIELLSADGKCHLHLQPGANKVDGCFRLSLRDIAPGFYLLRVKTTENEYTGKLLIINC